MDDDLSILWIHDQDNTQLDEETILKVWQILGKYIRVFKSIENCQEWLKMNTTIRCFVMCTMQDAGTNFIKSFFQYGLLWPYMIILTYPQNIRTVIPNEMLQVIMIQTRDPEKILEAIKLKNWHPQTIERKRAYQQPLKMQFRGPKLSEEWVKKKYQLRHFNKVIWVDPNADASNQVLIMSQSLTNDLVFCTNLKDAHDYTKRHDEGRYVLMCPGSILSDGLCFFILQNPSFFHQCIVYCLNEEAGKHIKRLNPNVVFGYAWKVEAILDLIKDLEDSMVEAIKSIRVSIERRILKGMPIDYDDYKCKEAEKTFPEEVYQIKIIKRHFNEIMKVKK